MYRAKFRVSSPVWLSDYSAHLPKTFKVIPQCTCSVCYSSMTVLHTPGHQKWSPWKRVQRDVTQHWVGIEPWWGVSWDVCDYRTSWHRHEKRSITRRGWGECHRLRAGAASAAPVCCSAKPKGNDCLLCKARRQQLLTFQVISCCLLALRCGMVISTVAEYYPRLSKATPYGELTPWPSVPIIFVFFSYFYQHIKYHF